MPLYLDADSGAILSPLGDSAVDVARNLGLIKRAGTLSLPVQFLRDGVVQELSNPSSPVCGFKLRGKRDTTAYAASALSWAKTGTGIFTVYTFTVTFLSAAIDTALNVDGNDANDLLSLNLEGEIKWSDDNGDHKSTEDLLIKLLNNVVRGGETTTSVPGNLDAVTLPSITRLIGGTATDLDSIPLALYQNLTFFDIAIEDSNGNRGAQRWQKIAGDQVSGGGYIRTLDYNATTNPYVLVRVL